MKETNAMSMTMAPDVNNEIDSQSEERYRNIIENINLGLLEVDLSERIRFANNSFCGLTGYSLAEIIGKGASKLVFGESKDREILKQWIIDRKAESGTEPLKENPLRKSSISDHTRKYFRRVKDLLRQVAKQLFRRQFLSLSYL